MVVVEVVEIIVVWGRWEEVAVTDSCGLSPLNIYFWWLNFLKTLIYKYHFTI